jgi:hypothetical protein
MSQEGSNFTWKGLNKGPAPWSVQVTNEDLHQFKLWLNKANIPVVGYADGLLLFAPTKHYAE